MRDGHLTVILHRHVGVITKKSETTFAIALNFFVRSDSGMSIELKSFANKMKIMRKCAGTNLTLNIPFPT